MQKKSLLLVVFSALAFAACSPQNGKLEYNPNDIGQDIDTSSPNQEKAPTEDVPEELIPQFPIDAQTYYQAWKRVDTALLLDCYQGNSINWDKVSTDKRITGVIHRTTIGMNVDAKFFERKAIADKKGFLWGGYHLGLPGNPIEQAKLYLRTIGDTKNTLMVLDLEDTADSKFMNISEAKIFLKYVYEQTGRIPVVYANHSNTKTMSKVLKDDPYFKASRIWYARYRSSIPDFPKGLWPSYFLWQFSSHLNCSKTGSCLYNVPGTDRYIDVNVYYGTRESLIQQWLL